MKFNIFYLFCMSMIFFGCSFHCKEMVAFGRVTSRVDNILEKEQGLQIFGTGMIGPGYFKGLRLSYISSKKVTRDEARRVFLKAMDTLIKTVNDDADFVQYMKPPPFTTNQLSFSLNFFHDFTNQYIGRIIMVHNNISYYLINPETCISTEIARETLEEALSIVEAEGMRLDYLRNYMKEATIEE